MTLVGWLLAMILLVLVFILVEVLKVSIGFRRFLDDGVERAVTAMEIGRIKVLIEEELERQKEERQERDADKY
jgi:hypothetical protein